MTVARAHAFLALTLSVALLPSTASAVEPSQAPAMWQEIFGDDALQSMELGHDGVAREGEPIAGRIEFAPDAGIEEIQYQICYVGESCFAIGVSTQRVGDTFTWNTADLSEDVGRPAPETYDEGRRVGFQFFVCRTADGPCSENPLEWSRFPEGEEDCVSAEDFVACEETHYFAIDIQEGSKGTPAPGILGVALVGLALAAWRRHD